MTYLDTHVVVWLYRRDLELLSEIQSQRPRALTVLRALEKDIGLKVCELPFPSVFNQALGEKWGRDLFDRLIVAQAKANNQPLITKDRKIRQYYRQSVW